MNESPLPSDFSLVLGGPLYQLWRGARLADDTLRLLHRRVLVMVLLTWVPLLLLSIAEGHAWGDRVRLPFLHDVELHVRLLIALPLLILAELIVHQRLRPDVRQFLDRGLIPDAARPQFDAAIASAMRLRNSVVAEVLLIALVYVVGVGFVWRTQVALDVPSWYGVPGGWAIAAVGSPAGGWASSACRCSSSCSCAGTSGCSSGRASCGRCRNIELRLVPTHPDRAGGLGFLGAVAYAFSPVLLAQGAMLGGMIANRIFYAGATLPEFKVEIIGLVALMVFAVLGPMLVFSPKLAAAKRAGLREYGTLAQRYVREFDGKWLRGGAPADEPLIGTADIQSLADLGNSFEVVRGMRWVPFTGQTVLQLAVATLLPVVAADADDVFAAGIARAVAQDCLLTIRPSPKGSSRRVPRLI